MGPTKIEPTYFERTEFDRKRFYMTSWQQRDIEERYNYTFPKEGGIEMSPFATLTISGLATAGLTYIFGISWIKGLATSLSFMIKSFALGVSIPTIGFAAGVLLSTVATVAIVKPAVKIVIKARTNEKDQ